MFYYNFVDLCNKKGISPSAAAEEMGFQRSVVTRWSKGISPRQATLQRVAGYFDVSVEQLQGEQKTSATENGSGGLNDTRYHELNEENRQIIDDLIEKLAKAQLGG